MKKLPKIKNIIRLSSIIEDGDQNRHFCYVINQDEEDQCVINVTLPPYYLKREPSEVIVENLLMDLKLFKLLMMNTPM